MTDNRELLGVYFTFLSLQKTAESGGAKRKDATKEVREKWARQERGSAAAQARINDSGEIAV